MSSMFYKRTFYEANNNKHEDSYYLYYVINIPKIEGDRSSVKGI